MNKLINLILSWFRKISWANLFRAKNIEKQEQKIIYQPYFLTVYDCQIIDLINTYRESKDLSRLLYAPQIINSIAYSHVKYLDENVKSGADFKISAHYNFPQRFFQVQLYLDEDVKVGENVSYNYSTANSTVHAWINSDGHRKTIEGDYSHIGVASLGKFTETLFIKP